ncbi:hypothetical protein CHELA1G11_10798 [Hyphomicrobiales bacterium]|nr:hypothetical protein CHELA1G11_10798 [Hyphomicrobiales bacterium]
MGNGKEKPRRGTLDIAAVDLDLELFGHLLDVGQVGRYRQRLPEGRQSALLVAGFAEQDAKTRPGREMAGFLSDSPAQIKYSAVVIAQGREDHRPLVPGFRPIRLENNHTVEQLDRQLVLVGAGGRDGAAHEEVGRITAGLQPPPLDQPCNTLGFLFILRRRQAGEELVEHGPSRIGGGRIRGGLGGARHRRSAAGLADTRLGNAAYRRQGRENKGRTERGREMKGRIAHGFNVGPKAGRVKTAAIPPLARICEEARCKRKKPDHMVGHFKHGTATN